MVLFAIVPLLVARSGRDPTQEDHCPKDDRPGADGGVGDRVCGDGADSLFVWYIRRANMAPGREPACRRPGSPHRRVVKIPMKSGIGRRAEERDGKGRRVVCPLRHSRSIVLCQRLSGSYLE